MGSQSGRSNESVTVEAVKAEDSRNAKVKHESQPTQSQQSRSTQPASNETPGVQSNDAAAFTLDAANQHRARELFENIFGHLGKDFQPGSFTVQAHGQAPNHSETEAAPLTSVIMASGEPFEIRSSGLTVKQEGPPHAESLADDVTLASVDSSLDDELMNAIASMNREDAPHEDVINVCETSDAPRDDNDDMTGPWAPSGTTTSLTKAQVPWDALGLDLGLDLNVDLDVDLDSSIATSLGLHETLSFPDVGGLKDTAQQPLWV